MYTRFTYEGKVMRTSKTKMYTHAVIVNTPDGYMHAVSCHTRADLAFKALHTEKARAKKNVQYCEDALNGKASHSIQVYYATTLDKRDMLEHLYEICKMRYATLRVVPLEVEECL
jgi:glyceraldehyde-3-phosphate dehydrogenase/erythrose-4-phosphate dehydrogenase